MTSWLGYPQTVARRVAQNFPSARTGADIAFASDLPRAAGMSSSSAIVVAMFLTLSALNDLPSTPEYQSNLPTPEDLAGYCGTIENGQSFKSLPGDRGVGTFGGSEDHTAILLSQPHHLVQYAYCPVRHEQTIPFPKDHCFAIASSGVTAEKAGDAMHAYNNASLLARAALAEFNRLTHSTHPTLAAAIRQGGPTPHESIRRALANSAHPDFPPQAILDRFDQFHAENEQIVPAFVAALRSQDWPSLGTIADRSQHLAETLLKNQIPQTTHLARSARTLGARAATAFGAGFGGSVWALIPAPNASRFIDDWKDDYSTHHPTDAPHSTFFTTHPGPPAFRITL
jgi:galactokinase